MKGIMVPLLALMMTTTVIGQQNSQTEESNARQLLMRLDDNWLNALKTEMLTVSIQPGTNRIVLWYDAPDSTDAIPASANPASVLNITRNGNRLIFKLDESDLRRIRTRGLVYNYRAGEKDRFQTLLLDFDRPAPVGNTGANNQGRLPNTNNQNTAGTGNNFPTPSPVNDPADRRDSSLLNPRGNMNGNLNGQGNNRPQPDDNQFSGNGMNGNGNVGNGNNRGNNGMIPPNNRGNFGSNQNTGQTGFAGNGFDNGLNGALPTSELERERELSRIANQEKHLAQIEADRLEAARLRQQRLDLERQTAEARQRRETELYYQQLRQNQNRTILPNGQLDPVRERWADNSSIQSPYPPINYPSQQFMNRAPNYSDQLNLENQQNGTFPPRRVAMQTQPSGPSPLQINGPAPLDQAAQNVKQVIDDAKSKVVADVNRLRATDQTNGFLGFLLLCSIGLNVYLLWIARGFYVRYSELADELRETFTSSM